MGVGGKVREEPKRNNPYYVFLMMVCRTEKARRFIMDYVVILGQNDKMAKQLGCRECTAIQEWQK